MEILSFYSVSDWLSKFFGVCFYKFTTKGRPYLSSGLIVWSLFMHMIMLSTIPPMTTYYMYDTPSFTGRATNFICNIGDIFFLFSNCFLIWHYNKIGKIYRHLKKMLARSSPLLHDARIIITSKLVLTTLFACIGSVYEGYIFFHVTNKGSKLESLLLTLMYSYTKLCPLFNLWHFVQLMSFIISLLKANNFTDLSSIQLQKSFIKVCYI